MFPGAVVTLLGDTNQAILPLINTTDTSLLEEIYGAETLRLNKSYRSTKEINEFALSLLPEERRYEIFRRDGEKVDFTEGNLTELSELVKLSTQDDTGVCIITSTIEGARRLHHRLFPLNNEIKLCDTSKGQLSHKPFIMPLVLTKGLEFDRVIVYNDGGFEGEENKSNLYMASTRALHKLTIFNEKD
jgi:DNA helicase-2/ATP-dependent DNA helicase PcrA